MAQAYDTNSIKTQEQSQSALFVLKVWEEKLGGRRVEWRGEVLDVGSNAVSAFKDWPDLIDLIAEALDKVSTRTDQAQPAPLSALPPSEE